MHCCMTAGRSQPPQDTVGFHLQPKLQNHPWSDKTAQRYTSRTSEWQQSDGRKQVKRETNKPKNPVQGTENWAQRTTLKNRTLHRDFQS